MDVLEKFKIIPLSKLNNNQLITGKERSILPIFIGIGIGLVICYYFYHNRKKEKQE